MPLLPRSIAGPRARIVWLTCLVVRNLVAWLDPVGPSAIILPKIVSTTKHESSNVSPVVASSTAILLSAGL
jgi:hypothetical protein